MVGDKRGAGAGKGQELVRGLRVAAFNGIQDARHITRADSPPVGPLMGIFSYNGEESQVSKTLNSLYLQTGASAVITASIHRK